MNHKKCFALTLFCIVQLSLGFTKAGNSNYQQADQLISDSNKPTLVLPTGHTLAINAVAYSPDGNVVATAGEDDTIGFWNAKTGNALRTLTNHPGITLLAYSPKGGFLGGWGETPAIWDADTGEELNIASLPGDFEFTPDDKFLVGSAEGTTKLWSIGGGKEMRTFAGTSFALSSDGKRIATSDVSTVRVWNVNTGGEIRGFPGTSFALNSDGKRLVISQGTTLKVWNVDTGNEIHSFTGTSFSFSANGRRLAARQEKAIVKVWNVDTGEEITNVQYPEEQGRERGRVFMEYSPDGRFLAIVAAIVKSQGIIGPDSWRDITIKLFDAETGALISSTNSDVNEEVRFVEISPDSRVLAVVFSQRVFLGSNYGQIKVWQLSNGREMHNLKGHSEGINSIAFSPDGQTLASVSGGGLVAFGAFRLWDVTSGNSRAVLSHTSNPLFIDMSRDGTTLASANLDMEAVGGDWQGRAAPETNGIRLWDVVGGKDTQVFPTLPVGVAFSGDGRLLAGLIGMFDDEDNDKTRVSIIDIAARREKHSLVNEKNNSFLAFAPDGKSVATSAEADSGDSEPEITVWDVATGKKRFGLQGKGPIAFSTKSEFLIFQDGENIVFHDVITGSKTTKTIPCADDLGALAVSPDGALLAGADEAVVHVWRLVDGVERHHLSEEEAPSLSFSSDSMRLVAGGHPFRVWNMSDGGELAAFKVPGDYRGFVRFGANPNILIGTSPGDRRIRIWDIAKKSELAELISIEKKDWVVITPDGLFDGSPGAFSKIFWRFSKSLFDVAPVEAYFSEFYYPGLLTDIFAGVRPVAPSDISQKDRRQIPLQIKTAAKTDPTVPVTSRSVSLEIEVEEAPAALDRFNKKRRLAASGVKDIRLFRNGTLVKLWRGEWGEQDGCKIRPPVGPGPRRVVCLADIPIVAGGNRFAAYAFNRDNVKSQDAELVVTGAESLRRTSVTHILTIGINEYAENPSFKDLTYAEKDAETFSQDIASKQKLISGRQTDVIPPIYSEEATKEKILAALGGLAGKVNPEDSMVIFYSGHGKATNDGRFYLIPHDVGYKTQREILQHSISDLELEEIFRGMDAEQILLIIDACNSGQAMESKEEWRRGPMNSKGLAQLAYEKGMYLLAAAQGYQAAVEMDELKGGLLTYVLLKEGLTSAADIEPQNNQIITREWLDFAVQTVPNKQREIVEQAQKQGKTISFIDIPKGDREQSKRSAQTPRVFYRREPDAHPFIIMDLPK